MTVAGSLRIIFPTLSVLLPDITRETGMSSATASYLTTLPVLCLGLFAPLAPGFARRAGIERTLLYCLILLAAGTALRGMHGLAGLFLGSMIAGASIAVANVLLPALVKRDFAGHIALMTALYTVAFNGGAAISAAITLPILHGIGQGWPAGLSLWAAAPLLAALIYFPIARHAGMTSTGSRPKAGGLLGNRLAWQVTLFMGLQSSLAYCVSGWLAPILQWRGLDGTTAGWVTSVSVLLNVPGALTMPWLVGRFKDQRLLNIGITLLSGLPFLGILFAPVPTLWVWAVLQGLGQGGMFAIALTIIVLRSPDSTVAAQLSSMAQTGGYLIASLGPLMVGLLHGWTGSYAATAGLFIAITVGALINGWGAGRNTHVNAGPAPASPQ